MQRQWMSARALAMGAATAVALCACAPRPEAETERGRYLVAIIGCGDCHTPGGFTPKPDAKRVLAGSDAEFEVPGEGVFTPPNLTPDKATGLGGWTKEQIVTAITTGVRPDGRILAAPMPWPDFAHLSKSDAMAIAAYLQSLPPVSNKVPGPSAPRSPAGRTVESVVFPNP